MAQERYSWPKKVILASEALAALGHARLILHRTRPQDILARNCAAQRSDRHIGNRAALRCAEVSFIIPRLAQRLPWRADCLVQALAAQGMLMRRGVPSEIAIGTAKHPDGSFEAHAWLVCRGEIILGGDVARFSPLIETPGPEAGAS